MRERHRQTKVKDGKKVSVTIASVKKKADKIIQA
jgi:hypothetical protein